MEDKKTENADSPESWLTGKIKAITGVIVALTALVAGGQSYELHGTISCPGQTVVYATAQQISVR